MDTRNTPCLVIVIFSDELVKIKFLLQIKFLLLCLDRYLFSAVIGNRYLPRGSKENVFSIAIIGSVTMSRQVILVVTILFLDFVMIH